MAGEGASRADRTPARPLNSQENNYTDNSRLPSGNVDNRDPGVNLGRQNLQNGTFEQNPYDLSDPSQNNFSNQVNGGKNPTRQSNGVPNDVVGKAEPPLDEVRALRSLDNRGPQINPQGRRDSQPYQLPQQPQPSYNNQSQQGSSQYREIRPMVQDHYSPVKRNQTLPPLGNQSPLVSYPIAGTALSKSDLQGQPTNSLDQIPRQSSQGYGPSQIPKKLSTIPVMDVSFIQPVQNKP